MILNTSSIEHLLVGIVTGPKVTERKLLQAYALGRLGNVAPAWMFHQGVSGCNADGRAPLAPCVREVLLYYIYIVFYHMSMIRVSRYSVRGLRPARFKKSGLLGSCHAQADIPWHPARKAAGRPDGTHVFSKCTWEPLMGVSCPPSG